MNEWVERLVELTGWSEPPWECEWAETEAALGVSLPADYKELCARFGPGIFGVDYFTIMADQRAGRYSLLRSWAAYVDRFANYPYRTELTLGPYEVYTVSGGRGVIPWGAASPSGVLFWLADASSAPESWPILGRYDLSLDEGWHRFDMSASEFVYRTLADPEFRPFSVDRWGDDVPRVFWRSILE